MPTTKRLHWVRYPKAPPAGPSLGYTSGYRSARLGVGTREAAAKAADAHPDETILEVTTPRPSDEELEEMVMDSVVDATDGCMVEPDGCCQHGHPSWLIALGLI